MSLEERHAAASCEETWMENTLEQLKKQGPTDVQLRIPEPLHRRLSEHHRMSGEQIEGVVIRALDDYFAAHGPQIEEALKALGDEAVEG